MGATRGIVALGLAGALTIASGFGAAPATADAAGTVSGGSRVVAGGFASARQLVAFTCAALTDSAATSVSVSECTLTRDGVPIASADPVSAPGAAATTSDYAVIDLLGPLEVCWTVDATFADGSTATHSDCGEGFLAGTP